MTEKTDKKTYTLTSNRFAFYGTLRKNQGNHRWSVAQDSGAKFDGTITVPGYKMYSLGGYPFVTPSENENDSVVVELYTLSDETTMQSIHRMEVGAGYHVEQIAHEGGDYQLYVQTSKDTHYYEEVPNGDWVEYVNARNAWRQKEREKIVGELNKTD